MHLASFESRLVHSLECAGAGRVEFVVFDTQTRMARLLVEVKGQLKDEHAWQALAELVETALHNARAGNFKASTWAALTDIEDW